MHSIRSLINIVTNETPHETLLNYQRKSATSKVLLRRFVKNSKYDPGVIEVEIFEANPQYAYIKYPNGRESTGSLRHLAPIERNESASKNEANAFTHQKENPVIQDPLNIDDIDMENEHNTSIGQSKNMNVVIEPNIPLQRSTQTRKPVVKLNL